MLEKELFESMVEDYTQLIEAKEVQIAETRLFKPNVSVGKGHDIGPALRLWEKLHQINLNTMEDCLEDLRAKRKALRALLSA